MVTPPLSLDDFKTFLRVSLSDLTLDDELEQVLDAATSQVETVVGPMVTREATDLIRDVACDGSFMLKTWPVVTVSAVVDHFTAATVDVSTLDIDVETGLVCGARSSRGYDVTSTVGRVSVPPDLVEVTKIVGEQLWQSRRGPSAITRFAQSGVGDSTQVPAYRGFAWPNRATQLVDNGGYRKLWC